ncbi:MAG: formate hydrogenlyase subunit 3/multisubunit Na+/H+ antiporter MnhD subunit [Verrucomicrobiales bacterium]|jgi:formate hydrogenlyase subunit 3/multisubunit Na+/H+ antiporter MnhD subunit
MNWDRSYLYFILLASLLTAIVIFFIPENRSRLRTVINLIGATFKLVLVILLMEGVSRGIEYESRISLLAHMDLVLRADRLGLLFISLSTVLWFLTTIYAIGYLEGSKNRSRFFGFFSLCVFSTVGVALAGNFMTFFIFYELLTLSTYPLVVHRGTPDSLKAGRIYLTYTLGGGAFLLVGLVWLSTLAGNLEFQAGGFLGNLAESHRLELQCIFVLMIAGLGVKAALVPLHGWLPQSMVAPAPVSALLHAVAVVKAGAFGIVRVFYDVYGVSAVSKLGVSAGLAGLAAVTIIWGSVLALFQDELKKRLAYSTVSQVSYIILGTALIGQLSTIGGLVHLVHQGLMKITLFFCAGNLAETLGIHRVREMSGVGKRMPLTMGAFTICALGMIGVPPMAGFVSKWYLGIGSLEAGDWWVVVVLGTSSLLNAAYFLPMLYRVWFCKQEGEWPKEQCKWRFETHWMLLAPPVITAIICILIGVFAESPWSPLEWVKTITDEEYAPR